MVPEIRLTNQLSPGVNLPIFSYIFHVEQGFVHDFVHQQYERVGHPLKKKVTIRCVVTPSWDAMVTIRMFRSFSTEPSFFHYYWEGGGANPNYALKKASIAQNGDLKPSRSKQNQQPNKQKKRKRIETSPTRKPFPIPSFPWKKFPIPTKTEKGNFCILFRST